MLSLLVQGATLAALLLFAAALVAECCRCPRGGNGLLGAAWVVTALLFVWDWELAQAPPFGNMRHVLSFLPLVSVLPVLFVRGGCRLQGYMAAASLLALIGALCMPLQAGWRQAPALQSPWFAPHVTAYVVSYAWLTVATLMVLLSYLRPSAADTVLRAAERLVVLAFPLMTFGLGSGALWADDAWGTYWSWDIKEAWSLLTWTLYLLWFHRRGSCTPRQRRPLLLLAFAALVVTFLVVNLLPGLASMHSYAG
ncbi:MAG: cytochrome c biogenesis protein CcsA [Akkermansia sp.]